MENSLKMGFKKYLISALKVQKIDLMSGHLFR